MKANGWTLLVSAIALCLTPTAWAEQPYPIVWVRQEGTPLDDYAFGVGADGAGNAYIAGSVRGDFPNVLPFAFVSKYDSLGNHQWAREHGFSDTQDYAWALAVDAAGNSHVVGSSQDWFGTNISGTVFFVNKYDPDGNRLWTTGTAPSGHEFGNGVAVDAEGNVYVTGSTGGDLYAPNAGWDDVFLCKYNASGALLWGRQVGTPQPEDPLAIALDGSGGIYVTGRTLGSLGGDNAGSSDAFILKYDPSGNLLWSRQWGTTQSESAWGVAADASGHAYVAVTNARIVYPDGSTVGPDGFLLKYDASGNLLWTRAESSPGGVSANAVAVDPCGNAFVAGGVEGDCYVSKYAPSGLRFWTQTFGSLSDAVSAITVGQSGDVYVAGSTVGSLGGPNAGGSDAFIAKLERPITCLAFRDQGKPWIPGIDHVGLVFGNRAYESHPGYPTGDYYDPYGGDYVPIPTDNGVQWRHTPGSFAWCSIDPRSSDVRRYDEIAVPEALAQAMAAAIESQHAAGYVTVCEWPFIVSPVLPVDLQKGGGGNFTCCGLVEWAAESAGHNAGQGFVPDAIEHVTVVGPLGPVTVTTLTPQLLYWAAEHPEALFPDPGQWLQAIFDPVDFMLTDPSGRRLGYTAELGLMNEIPGALYSGDGYVEQLLILDALPGEYTLVLFGLEDEAFAGIASSTEGWLLSEFLNEGQMAVLNVTVVPGPPGLVILALGGLALALRRRHNGRC